MNKGPLVKVEIRPGQFVKMYRDDAIAAGHLKAKEPVQNKMQPQPANKMRLPEEDKEPDPAPADDFTSIPGVGPATARALVAHGITTFEQLRDAENLDYLTETVKAAIEEWKVD